MPLARVATQMRSQIVAGGQTAARSDRKLYQLAWAICAKSSASSAGPGKLGRMRRGSLGDLLARLEF